MNTTTRITLLAPLLLVLGACSNLTERQMETCVVGLTTAGGVIGAASSGGTGVLPGAMIGTGISLISCEQGQEAPAPRQAPPPADSDGDGVPDDRDRCPRTPAGVDVDGRGCPVDGDRDGVADYLDQCAGTPAGVKVDEIGCPIKDEVVLTINRLGFAFDSAELDRSSKAALDRAVEVIKSHSEVVNMNVVGHTDSRGDEEYNQKLSERRAAAVVDYLVSKGVSRSSLSSSGKGESEPMASNDTDDGRAQNRRVELVVE
ncbi:OmpA family protein [Chromatocurvus halotolerans]|uniref:OOP family OmpA-OmpF porin n=1 Tax=Chromatocurvus halotolerans TaxID=1132028 RepID=A0A4V2SBH1_9GAMM|nr:OmpA family protein [Chromatocurvus halotolerans]TCO75450.1 OOP family OmpA-OmpF porin [Chromatocurvus halotolerans]